MPHATGITESTGRTSDQASTCLHTSKSGALIPAPCWNGQDRVQQPHRTASEADSSATSFEFQSSMEVTFTKEGGEE